MAFHHGISGPCWWSCLLGAFSEEDVRGFLDHLRDAAAHAVRGSLILDITHDVPMPTAVQRKQITDIISRAPNLTLVAGHALVVSSPMARGALTAINWVVRPKFDEKVFGNPEAAVAWLVAQPRARWRHPARGPGARDPGASQAEVVMGVTLHLRRAFPPRRT